MSHEDEYQVWLLRIWRDADAETVIRYSLENSKTGRRIGFASIHEMVAYLQALYGPEQLGNGRDDSDDAGEE